MHKLINKWSISTFILFLIIKTLQFLKKIGFSAKEDGWRKVTRVYLRTEESKFTLACFGLNFSLASNDLISKQEGVIKCLAEFFKQQPAIHWQLKWTRFSAQRIKKDTVDIVHAGFNEDGSLKFIIPYFDSQRAANTDDIDEKLKSTLIQEIINIYNRTKALTDKRRPLIFKKQLDNRLLAQLGLSADKIRRQAEYYIERILSAVFIHFEGIPPKQTDSDYRRFDMPAFIKHKHLGFGPFNIICRLNDANAESDLWIQCSHVCIDGLQMQEILQELKAKWGGSTALTFPPLSHKRTIISKLSSTEDNKDGVYSVNQIVNFRSLLGITTKINKEHVDQKKKCITAFRLFIWKLGNHPDFREKKFLIPVNIPARNNLERTLGFVIIRPSIYFDMYGDRRGFLEFQQEFNRQAKTAIVRKGEIYELFEAYTFLPPIIYTIVLKLMPSAVREFVGSIGVSIINKADAFVAPFSDVHKDGFIALSNFFTSTEDGNIACYVSIKGPKDRINNYLRIIEEIAKTRV